jgi:isopropylmalate/homocitrate/citramalate synthase
MAPAARLHENRGCQEGRRICAAGKHSGRNALRTKLHSLGLDLSQEQLDDVFKRFKVAPTMPVPIA